MSFINWKVPILVSYAYMREGRTTLTPPLMREHKHFDIILDSGAFTAFKAKQKIELDDYCKFLETSKVPYKHYFTLDEIGNSQVTYDNFWELKNRGFSPVPVFTRGDDIKLFHEYYDINKFVGIGGIAGTENNSKYLKHLLENEGLKKYKTHWLGFWDRDFLFKYKPYSCDSTAWQHFVMFGTIFVYTNRSFKTYWRHDYKKDSVIESFCNKYGIDYSLLQRENEVWRNMSKPVHDPVPQVISAFSFLLFARDCKRFLNTDMYLVCSYGRQVDLLVKCIERFSKYLQL